MWNVRSSKKQKTSQTACQNRSRYSRNGGVKTRKPSREGEKDKRERERGREESERETQQRRLVPAHRWLGGISQSAMFHTYTHASVGLSCHTNTNVKSALHMSSTSHTAQPTSGTMWHRVYMMLFLRLLNTRRPSLMPRTTLAKLSSSKMMDAA